MKLDTLGKKIAWIYAKAEIIETTNPKTPVFGFKTMANGDKDFIKCVYNCPKTNEVLEVYEQSGTIIRYVNRGIYPISKVKRNNAKIEVLFDDGFKINLDLSSVKDKRNVYSKILPN